MKRRAGAQHRGRLNAARRTRAWERRGALVALAGLTAGALAVIVVLAAVAGTPPFVTGFLCGAVVVAIGAMAFWFVDHSAGAQNLKFGSYGEECTADLFGSRAARRSGWELRHNLWFGAEDVDHVAFGPQGVLVIESKWSNPSWRGRMQVLADGAVDQALRSARHVRCLLRAAGLQISVTPIVVQWGPGGWSDVDWTSRWFGEVFVLRGDAADDLHDEIDGITGVHLDPAELAVVRAALDARVSGLPSRSTT
jgi:hypothetical protein